MKFQNTRNKDTIIYKNGKTGQIQKKSEWLLNYNFKNSEDNKAMPVVLRKKKFALNPNLETKYEVEKIIFRHERFLKTIK